MRGIVLTKLKNAKLDLTKAEDFCKIRNNEFKEICNKNDIIKRFKLAAKEAAIVARMMFSYHDVKDVGYLKLNDPTNIDHFKYYITTASINAALRSAFGDIVAAENVCKAAANEISVLDIVLDIVIEAETTIKKSEL
jgi:hypothetical protein